MADIDKKIEKAIEPIVKMYSELETELMVLLAKHFKLNDEFINSDFWRIQKLDEMGAFNSQVIDYISRYTKRSPSKIKKALQEVYNANIDFDTLRSAYDNGKILINPTEILNDTTLVGIMRYAYNVETKRFIEISKLIESSVRKTYLDIVEKSYLATSTGVKSYGETIRESLNELANKGIKTLNYISKGEDGTASIRSYDIEGTVRREILTATRQLSGNLNHELIELTESEYVKFSEHLDCRPTHYDWQGTIARKEDWKDIADYGDVAGIYGINCRHYVEPYFQDVDLDDTITIKDKDGNKKEYKVSNKLKEYSKDDTNDSYSISQKQRYLERGIRSWKRRREMSKASGDTDMLKKSKSKIKEWSDRLDRFTDEHDRRRDFTREYVSNKKPLFNENFIDKDFKRVDNNVEHLFIYNVNGLDKIYHTSNDSTNSVGDIKAFELFENSKPNSLIAVHNHPRNSSFSLNDIKTFNEYQSINSIVVKTDKYFYFLEKNGINKVNENELVNTYSKIRTDYKLKYGYNTEMQHKINKLFSKMEGWNYGRVKR